MTSKTLLARLPIDPYIAAIVGMVCLASLLPARGIGAVVANHVTTLAIALLFFLHGRGWPRRRRWPGRGTGGCMRLCWPPRSCCFLRWR